MRYLRLSYIVPRVLLLVLFLLATEIGSGYLIRWGLIAGGQAAVDAKVEIGTVKSSLLETRVTVRDVAVANPRSPLKNLFVADRIEVDFDSHSLLRKKFVVDYGIVGGLEFGTDRQTSGVLPEDQRQDNDISPPSWAVPIATRYADAWLSDLESRLSSDVQQKFQSVRLAEELGQRWPEKYKQLEVQARSIKAEAKQLEQDVRTAKKNPLRHVDFLTAVPSRVASLRNQLRQLQDELARLPQQIAADRSAVEAARRHDEQMIREQLQLGNVDAKSLSNYLLGEQVTGPINEAIGWVRWTRRFVPVRGQVVVDPPVRGRDILFAGCEQLPDMLVKAVRLDGSARLGGQTVDLVGVVRDWTNQPELHTRPTTMELTTKGGLPMTIQAKFDRTRDTPRDQMFCSTSDLLLPEMSLGKPGKLQMTVAPARVDVTVDMQLVGEQLDGKVEIAQRDLSLTPSAAGGVLGNRLHTALASSFASIDHANTTVTLSGTLDQPVYHFDSTLGSAVASAINRAATDVITAERDRLLAKSKQQVDAELAKLNSEFTAFQNKLNAELQGPGEILAALVSGSTTTEIGHSPFGQLFK